MTKILSKEWQEVKAGDILEVLTDYHANGSYEKLKENVTLLDEPDYAIMIRTTNFENNDFEKNLKYVNEHAYEFLSKSKVFPNLKEFSAKYGYEMDIIKTWASNLDREYNIDISDDEIAYITKVVINNKVLNK